LEQPRVFVEAFWSPALALAAKLAGKSNRCVNSLNYRASTGEDPSLSGGASMESLDFFKLGITSFVFVFRPQTTRATLSDRPRFELLCRFTSSGSNPQRGPYYRRTAASRTASVGTTRRSRHWSRPS
jgi:hypothetical protein